MVYSYCVAYVITQYYNIFINIYKYSMSVLKAFLVLNDLWNCAGGFYDFVDTVQTPSLFQNAQ